MSAAEILSAITAYAATLSDDESGQLIALVERYGDARADEVLTEFVW